MLTRREVVHAGLRLVAAPALVSLGAACGLVPGLSQGTSAAGQDNGASSGTLQVAWWGGTDRAERTQKVMDQFSARFRQWKFDVSFTDFAAYWDKINTQAAVGGLPDVFEMDMRNFGQFVSKKLVLDMTRFDRELNLSDFDQGLLSQGKLDNGLYGIPLGGIVQATVYDKTAIQDAGMPLPTGTESWSDYATYCKKLSQVLPQGVYASDDESINIDPFEVYIRQRNKELYTTDGKPNCTHEEVINWFHYWADLRQAGAIVPPLVASAHFENDTPEAIARTEAWRLPQGELAIQYLRQDRLLPGRSELRWLLQHRSRGRQSAGPRARSPCFGQSAGHAPAAAQRHRRDTTPVLQAADRELLGQTGA